MSRKSISTNIERKLWVESMGRCMNPECQTSLFIDTSDMFEKAHINPYCAGKDNSFENLVILCPNCHKKFDKAKMITESEIRIWKLERHENLESMFTKKYDSFEEMKKVIKPLLEENKNIYDNYFLKNNTIWKQFEPKVLINNEKIKNILNNNMLLMQIHKEEEYSNAKIVRQFIQHVNEFSLSRGSDEKIREVLFPKEIDSIFGVYPVESSIMPMTESLEELLKALREDEIDVDVRLGENKPYIGLNSKGTLEKVYLDDTPRIRQMYYNYRCFRKTGVRLDALIYILGYIRQRGLTFSFCSNSNLREIYINETHIIFVYEYCLSQEALMRLDPDSKSIVVNLHNWNGDSCISADAKCLAEKLGVELLTKEAFQLRLRTSR